MQRTLRLASTALWVLCAACEGAASLTTGYGGTPETPGPTDPATTTTNISGVQSFSCDSTAIPEELPLRRVSRTHYLASVRDLIASTALTATMKGEVVAAVEPDLARFPMDRMVGVPGETHGGFRRLDQALQQAHVDVSYDVALRLGNELTSTAARRQALLGTCATDASTTNDATCLRTFVASFGRRALRGPLSTDELSFFTSVAGTTPVDAAAIADVIALMLTSPRFLYFVEEGTVGAGPVPLDAFALASRLASHFWQAPPDEALLQAAESGALLTEEGYRAQVERVFADPRTDATVERFFAEWFRLEELAQLHTLLGTPVFDAFAGDDRPTATLNEEMGREVLDLASWLTRHDGTVTDLLTSRKFFARTDGLARLYQQPRWDGASTPVDFEQPSRAGLLTRAAFLASASGNTRPVMKGFRIRNALLCQKIPPPPNNVNATPIALSPDLTTRETVEALTQQQGTSCLGCHGSTLNPLGFSTENFDALGRARTHQRLFASDGTVRLEKPVNTRVIPFVAGFTGEVDGVGDVTQLIATSGDFETCFARQLFRYSFGRVEDELRDGCALEGLQQAALSGRPLAEVLRATALRPEFKRRDLL